MIVVAGGTGRLGRLVATELAADGHPVRVIARTRPADPLPAGVELDLADVRVPATLNSALAGAKVVVSAVHGMDPAKEGSPHSIDRDGNINLVDAAARQGAAVVMVSVIGASPTHPIELHRMKWEAEEHLRRSGVRWTIVRASSFIELWREVVRATAGALGVPKVFGHGDNPINFVSVSDVATAVVRAVEDDSLRGAVIEVGGPRNLTLTEVAAQVATAAGEPRHIPRTALRVLGTVARPVRPGLARSARTSLAMDTTDLAFDPHASRATYPWLPCSSLDLDPR